MTNAIFNEEPYLQQLQTQITAIDDQWLTFEATIFYPLGGGQPGDIGELSCVNQSLNIIDTRKDKNTGEIIHQIESLEHGLKVGDKINITLNWQRRHRLMRMHSAMHILCSLIPRGVTGGSVGELKSRLDFDLGDHSVDKQTLTDRLNELVKAGHTVEKQFISEQALSDNPSLVRTLSVQPPKGCGDIRLINILGVDMQPCGGTHVKNTLEIGELLINKIENKGKRNRRIHLSLVNP
jgi:misacylated tRNA(Ala) deacylase